jgi:hypothetical protein
MDLADIYPLFNRLEGLLWFAIAAALPFVVRRRSRREALAVYLASLGFILFGLTDFIEAPLYGQIPGWLWAFKITCAALILSCRYIYLGWHRFHLSDRYLRFALLCLAATLGVILLQYYLST